MTKQPVAEFRVLEGPAGRLQAVLETPAQGAVSGCAVICHPHPLHGGTMQNKVVHTLARAFVNQGMAALRFNFRGVENSDGSYDEGNGELQDALAAARWLRQQRPGLPLWFGGFSFGAAIAIRAAAEMPAAGIVSIAPAIARIGGSLREQPHVPWLLIQGDNDELVDVDETIAWVNTLEPGPELRIFPDTDHFFHGKLVLLRRAVETFLVET